MKRIKKGITNAKNRNIVNNHLGNIDPKKKGGKNCPSMFKNSKLPTEKAPKIEKSKPTVEKRIKTTPITFPITLKIAMIIFPRVSRKS